MKYARFLVVALVLWMPTLVSNALAQARHKVEQVSGYVLDSVSRKPVPLILVEHGLQQTRTDETGYFTFRSSPDDQLYAGSYFSVNTVCYDGAAKRNANDSVTILLHRNEYRLGSICQPADSVCFRPYASPQLFDWMPYHPVAILIKNPQGKISQGLRSIRLYGSNSSSDYSGYNQEGLPFRVCIFRIDTLTGQSFSAKDLLHEGVLCFPKPGEAKVFDLREYHVTIPPGNFWVAFFPVVTGDHWYTCPPTLDNYHPVGPVLYAPCNFAETRTWQYDVNTWGHNYSPKGWQPIPPTESCWPVYENMVSVEVEPAPAKR